MCQYEIQVNRSLRHAPLNQTRPWLPTFAHAPDSVRPKTVRIHLFIALAQISSAMLGFTYCVFEFHASEKHLPNMKDKVRYQRVADVPGLVLSDGSFTEFSFDRHYHLDCHIGIVTEGVQRQRYKGRTEHVGPGCIAVMPPGVIHDGVREGGEVYTLKTFRIPYELLCQINADIGGATHEPELQAMTIEDAGLATQLTTLHAAMQAPQADPLALQAEWLSTLHRLFSRAHALGPGAEAPIFSDSQWQSVRDYCMAHLSEKITLEELAGLCGLQRFQFLRQFKRTIGMTPHAWLLRMRLEQSCTLLAHKAGSLTDIAQEVGFFDQSHFNRAFRHAFGVAPSQY